MNVVKLGGLLVIRLDLSRPSGVITCDLLRLSTDNLRQHLLIKVLDSSVDLENNCVLD